MKEFNITGTCIPHLHYMVDIGDKVEKVIELIEKGKYFVISRPRQYGKTTMIYALEQKLKNCYMIISTSFEGLGDSKFKNDESFCSSIFETFSDGIYNGTEDEKQEVSQYGIGLKTLEEVSKAITKFIKKQNKKVVLIIDEVDRASNFNLFISFLGMLRDKYLKRNSGKDSTFHSVVLAGVHDIKNIKIKMRPDSDSQYNSPWNIATEFKVDMSFSSSEIETMLYDYFSTTKTQYPKADIQKPKAKSQHLSCEIHKYTSGYPFLVSKICKLIDEELDKDWTVEGIQNAILKILEEQNTLFDDMIKNIENDPELSDLLSSVLVEKESIEYNVDNPVIQKGIMYGVFKKSKENEIIVHNKIFELRLYAYLASKQQTLGLSFGTYNYKKNFIDNNGDINIEFILVKFQEFIKDTYSNKDISFYEKHGRLLLIAFIKPIINGTGFYYIEPQQSYERRSDMIITYNNREYILELKLWYGDKYHQEGLKQLAGYLESRNHKTGYLVAFNFNKNKQFTNGWYEIEGKKIFEVLV